MMKNKKVLLGVTGGIAAYKACALTSKLVQQGADVRVVMTENATRFVSPLTFQALSRNHVYTDTFEEKDPKYISHIDTADWADIVILAPATANMIGKIASGIADDMLSTLLLATTAPVYVAPAMNVNMYSHPGVMNNMKKLEQWGYHFIEPGSGYLACGWIGKGRLEEPETIIATINEHIGTDQLLAGKQVLITAGPTREIIDPVRFFTNRSSGKMGFALAEAAARYGADVTLVAGPVHLETSHPNIRRINVISAADMYEAAVANFQDKDIVIKSAAVADYRPKHVHHQKMKKQPGNLSIEMERTTDILAALGERKTSQYLVGFAAETDKPLEYGKEKLKKKRLDAIVINNVGTEGAGFEGDTNIATYLNKKWHQDEIGLASKREVAERILRLIDRDIKDENRENSPSNR
ncbi:bifunctional phosphopantothenoylcysteine decarboxylase/phosphopantothenate--cysteine ligase CoaBC [Ornithinibacillus gellani]|uniref:bifunctional phosphopantothenoylcysteine decarboxylase/phosphopantothenate--cysteine ligase CoaBC n=1 Tax=Ornithinibacillus gellani TaxID=2293253 RepID=UPI000F47CEDA|nr:bifunctional phosphopantothenoylcysteine decarboxylase/phosphopantothenate--cysteine ligase CoaBC [Ornithinibacillus gellani]TQS75614.1 bifunctional phosphopantothenoylcysteine decarboxylase/phosphopantothenate--cysteine ligase CoaBC [Ornithinibacillus gellani]